MECRGEGAHNHVDLAQVGHGREDGAWEHLLRLQPVQRIGANNTTRGLVPGAVASAVIMRGKQGLSKKGGGLSALPWLGVGGRRIV